MHFLRFLPLCLLALLAAAFAWQLRGAGAPATGSYQDAMLNKPVPPLVLESLEAEQAFSTASLQGKPYLLNVFASWCAACKLEHETLKQLAESQGLPLYGIAWKDKPENTRLWLERMGNIYTQIGIDQTGAAGLELGLTGAPETYLITPEGTIATLYRGALSESVVQNRFIPAIAAMEIR